MYRCSLISLALISFSIATNATAIPMDADQVVPDAIQNAVLHRDVMLVQGGGSDKDVVEVLIVADLDGCQPDWNCSPDEIRNVPGDMRIYQHYLVNNWLVETGSVTLHSLMVLLILLSCVAFFLLSKSASAK